MRLVMMGTGTFAEPTFRALLGSSSQVVGLVTQPDRPVGQERGSTRQVGQSLKSVAVDHAVPVFQPESINSPKGIAGLQALQPELLVVAAFGQILSKDVLAIPPHGGINVHASLLPKYRGAAPVAWAIYHGETRTGVTIIKMSASVDAGDILAQEEVAIEPEDTAGELEARLAVLGSRLVLQVVEQIWADAAQRRLKVRMPVRLWAIKQDKTKATKAPRLTKKHGLIDWTRSARDVCNQVRAMQPWPTAYTYLHREGQAPMRLIVCKTSWQEGLDGETLPAGQLIVRLENPSRLLVAAGAGTQVEIQELQPAGKRRMPAAEFLRGHRLQAGDRLGPETL
jgi:methionyl-tRNA formyltransferase